VAEALGSGGVVLTAVAGYGKTTALEAVLADDSRSVAWIACSEAERTQEVLLMRVLEAISRAAPGAADALTERLSFPAESVDAVVATRELLADLPQLLVDPLVLVVDDAEHLEGAEGSLRLLGELIRFEVAPLRVAVASRRPLELRVAKARAAGRLHDLAASDLAFDTEECAEALRERIGRDPAPEEVDDLMAATEGWPLGVTLAVAGMDTDGRLEFRELRSAPDLRSFLSEELLESLDADLREGAISSSVAPVVTPQVAAALELPDGFAERIEKDGMLIRRVGDSGAFTYHPLLRTFLLELLADERPDEERRRLHGTMGDAAAASGDTNEAIEHWLEAREWAPAVAAIEREGPVLVRTVPGLMERWLAMLPGEARSLPGIRSLEGQLTWLAGDNSGAIDALRGAVRGFKEQPNPPADWLARSVLVDALFANGGIEDLDEVVAGWDHADARPAGGLAPAAVMYSAVVLAAFAHFDESERLADAARSHPDAELVAPLDALRFAFAEGPAGDLDEVLARLTAAAEELQRFDPLNRRGHLLGAVAFVLAERGEDEAALQMWKEIREIVRGGTAPVLDDATHAWCALLHARAGRPAEAETELAQHRGLETGYRAYIAELAPAVLASQRGDLAATLAHAGRTLEALAGGPILFRSSAAADLIPALIRVGAAGRAEEVLDQTLEEVDELLPGERGTLQRCRLVALRSVIRREQGDPGRADGDLGCVWAEAKGTLRFILRRDWGLLRPVIWDSLERGALGPEAVDAVAEAFPDGLVLVGFLEHPVPAVRRAALRPATESGDPEALVHLERLAEDPDPDLAAAAAAATERLARSLPPLRFELLGTFSLGRGSWRAEGSWERPVDARLVRFLLVNLSAPVPEDMIFDALWPQLSPKSARSSLRVAVSRARRVLDPPGAERSVLESADRTYRLVLGAADEVDTEQFRAAATAALADRSQSRRHLLERARGLWTGVPLAGERYEDWAAAYRERLIDEYTAVLAALADTYRIAGEHAEAAAAARDLVDLDPLNEGGHRALIVAFARAGRTGHALRQYLECRRALVEELGVEPSEETARLQARILAGEPV